MCWPNDCWFLLPISPLQTQKIRELLSFSYDLFSIHSIPLVDGPFINDTKRLDLNISFGFRRDRQWAQVRSMVQRNMESIDQDIQVSHSHGFFSRCIDVIGLSNQ